MAKWMRATILALFCAVWGFFGAVGGIWLMADSLEGAPGPTGPAGAPGAAGEHGSTGLVGPQGPPGTPADPLVLSILRSRITALEQAERSQQPCLRVNVMTDVNVNPGLDGLINPFLSKRWVQVCRAF